MDRKQLRKRLRGSPVAVPTPFAKDLDLDLPLLADLTEWWVDQGLGSDTAALKTSAAAGEGPELSDEEWPKVLRTVVETAGADKTVICGLNVKNTLHTIDDAKRAQDLGAIGVQIELPYTHHPTQDDLVRHFTAISDAIDIGIMVYNTHWHCMNPANEYLNADTVLRLRDAEHLVAIKWSVPAGEDYDEMRRFSDEFNVIDNTKSPVRCYKNGGVGFITGMIAAYPPYGLKLFQLLEQARYDEAQAEVDRVSEAMASWTQRSSARSGGKRDIKAFMAAVGRPVGDTRPPTLPCDEQEIAELRAIFQELGWVTAAEPAAAD